ncbi:hypothetical protein [Halobaculum lipolyticum]|uniref:Uncharacterized protein n=1 Tax=Halobaculum lipolyticum TaxID=3032001 RepID=A0ABD5WG84_9EURY|nr:hypothetical protein [Halobaculum sp. DT31]
MSEPDADLSETVLEEAGNRGPTMRLRDFVSLAERHHGGGPGVDAGLLARYARALDERGGPVEAADFEGRLSAARTDSPSWAGPDAVYEVGEGRVSAVPRAWHERLDGESALVDYLAVIRDDVADTNAAFDVGGAGYGVPASVLTEATAVVDGADVERTRAAIDRLRREGVFAVDADQHPHARVRFTDEARPDGLAPEGDEE